MYYRCIRFNTNQEKNQVRDTILLEQKIWVCWKLAHRTVQMSTSHSREFQGVLRYNSSDCPVSQRATPIQRQRSTLQSATVATVTRQKSEQQSQRAPECLVPQEEKSPTIDQLRTLTVRWRGGTPHKEQCMSGGALYCPVHPSPTVLANGYHGGWGL
jgi:hypothetical protein